MAGQTLGTAYVQIVPSAKGISGAISNTLGPEAQAAGTSAGTKIGTFAKKALLAVGIGAAVVSVMKASLDEGAKLQQSYYGGLDTLYGDAADSARELAKQASTAGISMNDYSEQAVSFGAALKKAYGGDTKKAVEAANTAILDMADNSAKMGTPLESIQQAYQGFAKGQYQLLDNLKLGYGGTKSEMERLLTDAEKLTGVKYDINNLGDVYDAIHVIQGDLGLTGVAAEEASQTLSGSFGAMKAAAQNFLGSLALGEDVTGPLTQLVQTAGTFLFNNLLPMVGNVLKALPQVAYTAISTGLPTFMAAGAEMLNGIASGITQNLPTVAANGRQMLVGMANSFLANLPTFIGKVGDMINAIVAFVEANLPTIMTEGINLVKQLSAGLVKNLPAILASMAKLAGTILSAIVKLAPKLMTAGAAAIFSLAKSLGGAALTAVKTAIGKVASALTAPIKKAKDTIKGIIDKVKDFFPIKLGNIFKDVKLPHFKLTGKFSLNPPSVPKLGIDWYKTGGIFDSPSVIGVGEAGPEAILPLDPFWDRMDKIAENAKGGGNVTVNVYASPGMNVNELAAEVERRIITAQKRRTLAWL